MRASRANRVSFFFPVPPFGLSLNRAYTCHDRCPETVLPVFLSAMESRPNAAILLPLAVDNCLNLIRGRSATSRREPPLRSSENSDFFEALKKHQGNCCVSLLFNRRFFFYYRRFERYKSRRISLEGENLSLLGARRRFHREFLRRHLRRVEADTRLSVLRRVAFRSRLSRDLWGFTRIYVRAGDTTYAGWVPSVACTHGYERTRNRANRRSCPFDRRSIIVKSVSLLLEVAAPLVDPASRESTVRPGRRR